MKTSKTYIQTKTFYIQTHDINLVTYIMLPHAIPTHTLHHIVNSLVEIFTIHATRNTMNTTTRQRHDIFS